MNRKIRTTLVGLVAMPAGRDESTSTADDLWRRELRSAFAEIICMSDRRDSTEHEDAALAMLPPVAGRRAA